MEEELDKMIKETRNSIKLLAGVQFPETLVSGEGESLRGLGRVPSTQVESGWNVVDVYSLFERNIHKFGHFPGHTAAEKWRINSGKGEFIMLLNSL